MLHFSIALHLHYILFILQYEIIDSIEIFIVPVLSILGSLATFGLFTLAQEPDDHDHGDTRSRELSAGDNFLTFVKVFLCVFGIVLALLVHLFKMLIRLLGEGCLTCCITTIEYTWITISLFLAIFIKPIAIIVAIILLGSAGYGFMKRQKVWRRDEGNPDGGATGTQQQQPVVPAQPQQQQPPAPAQQQQPIPVAQATPMNDTTTTENVVEQNNGAEDVEVQIEGSHNDEEDGFPAYNPDDFEERPPAVAPHDAIEVVPTAPIEPKD